MMKKHIALLVALLHVWSFSIPVGFAAPVITDEHGNVVSKTDENGNTYVELEDGGIYYCTGCDSAETEQWFIDILNSLGMSDSGSQAIINIMDGAASNWAGTLNINGILAIINQHGFNISDTFQANVVGGLVLSTLGIDPSEFFAGMAELSRGLEDPAAIINNGNFNIEEGFLALLASAVENNGSIAANGGAVVIGVGDRMTMQFDEFISVEIHEGVSSDVYDFEGNKIEDGIKNTGHIQTHGGMTLLTAEAAEGIFDNVINHSGLIEANTVTNNEDGSISLGSVYIDGGSEGITSITGDIYAIGDDVGETGGEVTVTGDLVGIFDDAIIEASGQSGGGTVHIGGDYQGLGTTRNANGVYVSPDAVIKADAILEGDGGEIVVWSEEVSNVHGTLSATGGLLSGDGGLIEASSKGYLNVGGASFDVTAANGESGTVLFDPTNLEVIAGSTGWGGGGFFESGPGMSQIGADDIAALLNLGINVILQTGAAGAQAGNIFVRALINVTGIGGTLTMNAFNQIIFDARLSLGRTGGLIATGAALVNLILNADMDGDGAGGVVVRGDATIHTNGGSINMNASSGITFRDNDGGTVDINTMGGDFTANADQDGDGNGTFRMREGAALNTGGGNASITAANLNISGNGGGTINTGAGIISLINSFVGATFGLGAGGQNFNINQTELDNMTADTIRVGSNTAGQIVVGDATVNNANTLSITTGADVVENTADAGADVTVSNLAINSGTGVDIDVAVDNLAINNSTSGAVNVTDTTGNLTIDTVDGVVGVTNNNADVTLNASAGDLIFNQGANAGTGNLFLSAMGAITQVAGNLIAAGLSFDASGNVTLDGAGNDFDTVAGTTTGGKIDIRDMDEVTVGTVGAQNGLTSTGNDIDVTTGGDLTINSTTGINAGATGDVTINSGGVVSGVDDIVSDVTGNNVSITASQIGGAATALDMTVHGMFTADTSAANGNIRTDSSDITINQINAGTGDVTMQSVGSIRDAAGDDTTVDIIGNNVSLTANFGGTIGTSATDSLNISANTITTNTSATGANQFITEENGLTGLNLNAGTGDITFSAGGDVTDTDGDVDVQANNFFATINGAFGSAANFIQTTLTNLSLDTSAANGNIFVNETDDLVLGQVNAGTGNVSLTVGGILSAVDDAVADIIGGIINLIAAQIGASAIDVSASTQLNADTSAANGKIEIDSIGDLPLGTVNAGTGDVTIESTGNITDANDGAPDAPAVTNVTGGIINLIAQVGGIGTAANAVDILASVSINADTTADNSNINLRSTGNAPVGHINAGTGDITFKSEGNITDANDGANIDNPGVVNFSGGTIDLETVNGDDIGEITNFLEVAPLDLLNVATNGGNMFISCAIASCPLGLIDLGTGLFAWKGGLEDGNDTENGERNGGLVNIIAGGALILQNAFGGGVGSATNWVEMQLSNANGGGGDGVLQVDAGAGNDIFISNTGALTLGGVGAAYGIAVTFLQALNGNNIHIDGNSPLTIAADIVAAGNLILTANGNTNADKMTINNGISIQAGGDATLMAGDRIRFRNGSSLTAGGNINVAAGADATNGVDPNEADGNATANVRMDNNSFIQSNGGNVTVNATRNARITRITSTTGDVTINADTNGNGTGRIEDNNGAAVNIQAAGTTTLSAGSGIGVDGSNNDDAIETETTNLHVTNTTSGNVNIDETAAGGDLNIISANQQGAGNMTIRTLNGILTVVEAGLGGLGVALLAGELLLEANGNNLVVNNTVTSTTGKINLDALDTDVVFSADGDVTATGGAEIEVNGKVNVTMADGTVLNANGGGADGAIDIDAGGNVTLGSVQTTSNAATSNGGTFDAVSIKAGGAVIDGGDMHDDIIANSGQTTILAANGIGDGNALETQIDRLDAHNLTSGNIQIEEQAAGGDLNIVRALQDAANGQINIQTVNGTLTVLAAGLGGLGVQSLLGQIFLIANGDGDDDVIVNNFVNAKNAKINIDSTTRDVIFSAEGDVEATGEIEISAARDVTMADGTVINAKSGGTGGETGDVGVGIDIDAGRNVTIGSVMTTSTAATSRGDANDAVSIKAGGAVIDGGDMHDDIIANSGQTTIVADQGIGSGNALETQIDRLHVTNKTANNIEIEEQVAGGALDIVTFNQQATNGNTIIHTLNGTLTMLAAAVGGLGGTAVDGFVQLFARDSDNSGDDDLVLNHSIKTNGGKVNLDSENDILASAEGDVTTSFGEIEADADQNIVMSDGTVWKSTKGNIDLDAANGDITIGALHTENDTDEAVVVVALNGAIIDGGDMDIDIKTGAGTPGVAGSGGGMILRAKTGIGSRGTGVNIDPDNAGNFFASDALDTMGGRLSAYTESGDIQIQNTGSLEITTLTDTDGGTPQGSAGAGTVTGVTINDPALVDPNSRIFITAASPMLVSSAVTNNDGGDITMYAVGGTAADFMTINADIRSIGGDGDIRLISGGDMTMGPGVTVSTQGDGVTSGTGQVIAGAGFDATGMRADESVATLVGVPIGVNGLGNVNVTNGNANFTMDISSTISTEDGNIQVHAGNNITLGLLHADGTDGVNGITDGTRGNVLTNSINGSTLDAAPVGDTELDIFAEVWNAFSGGTIGLFTNPIEVNAPFINTISVGSQFIRVFGTSLVNLASLTGDILLNLLNGDVLLGRIHAENGIVDVSALNGSILAVQGGVTHIIADSQINLSAGGVIGTADSPVNTQMNNPGTLTLRILGAIDNLSANITGNFAPSAVSILTAVGLVLFNGSFLLGGDNFGDLGQSLFGTLHFNILPNQDFNYSQIDGQWNADFPGFFNLEEFATSPIISIGTAALDAVQVFGIGLPPVTEPTVPPTVVPVPEPAVPPVTEPVVEQPETTVQPTVPTDQEDLPPTVVPIPEDATPTTELTTEDNIQVVV